jgi:TDG/mug DNA glycosylase family protein
VTADDLIFGLPPILGNTPKLLILGSMPSVKSITYQQYYAHPQNAFWPIVAKLFGFTLSADYLENIATLKQQKVAVWDVLASCERKGSLDSAIVKTTEVVNPVAKLLINQPSIKTVALNGGAAYSIFRRHHKSLFDQDNLKIVQLPSSSPAHATLRLAQKQDTWQQLLEIANL